MTLSTSAMLVSLRISQWSARKYDRSASKQVCELNEASLDAGNFNKQLIDKADLKQIQRVVNSARNYHYQNTLAWDHDGADLLPAKHYATYVREIGAYKDEFYQAVDNFVDTYPEILTHVINNLKGLYNSKDYPTQAELHKKFSMEIVVTPIPDVGDFRVDLSQKDADTIKEELTMRLAAANQVAAQDIYMRLYTAYAKAVVVLQTPGKIFRNSLILNILELANKIPDLNFQNDPALHTLSQSIIKDIRKIDIEELRNSEDSTYREDTANDLQFTMESIELAYTDKWGIPDDL